MEVWKVFGRGQTKLPGNKFFPIFFPLLRFPHDAHHRHAGAHAPFFPRAATLSFSFPCLVSLFFVFFFFSPISIHSPDRKNNDDPAGCGK